MGLNPEALAALESLRQQLVADGHPDERDEPEQPQEAKPPRSKREKKPKNVKRATASPRAKKAKDTAPKASPATETTEAATEAETPVDSQQKPKRRVGKDGKVYPTATQKRRARRKRALEREQSVAAEPPTA